MNNYEQFMIINLFIFKDFEAMTPNLLARTIETVEGGGIITILLNSMNSLKQLYAMTMVSGIRDIDEIIL
jgi:tRNA(Met) C34 N-acetyltransferase TmcA